MILKVSTIFQEKIWGGNKISKKFNNKELEGKRIGEAWIVSGFKGYESHLDNQELNLNEFYKKNKELFNNYETDEFPLLIKILDAKDDLSIQVHPNNEEALKLDNYPFGKLEAWYILDTPQDNEIIVGTKTNSKTKIKNLVKEGRFLDVAKTHKINNGDVFEIKEGTLHAIKSNTFLYEVQQSSDLTYRFYDYDRLDNNGQKRELHVDKSLKVLKFNNTDKVEPFVDEIDGFTIKYLISNEKFELEKWELSKDSFISFDPDEKNFLIITCIKGEGNINNTKINKYESIILTKEELEEIILEGEMELLVANPV